jgi:ABC-type branched-subunit amino acid transport system substrate-binding protein
MRITRFHRRAAASVLALAMLASACGSDDKDSEATTTTAASETTETTAAPPTGEPIKFGTTIWTLPQISLEIRIPGIKAAVEDINAHGGIAGRPVEWVYCPAADANEGEACARKMVDEGVVATVSDANLSAEQASVQILADAGIPQIDPFVNSPEALNNPNVFIFSASTPIEYAAVVGFMKEKGLKSIHFLAGAMGAAQNSVDSVTKAAEYYDMEIVGRTDIPLSATDYSPYVAEADDAGADVNMTIIAPFMSGLLLQAAQQLGVQAKVGLSEAQFNADTVRDFAPELEGSLMVSSVPPISAADDYPEMKRAVEAINAYFEESNDPNAAPGKLSTLSLRSWVATQAFATVANEIEGDITAASVKEAFGKADIDTGLDKPWKPGTQGPASYTRVSNAWMYLSEVKGGKTVLFQKDPIDALVPFKAAG